MKAMILARMLHISLPHIIILQLSRTMAVWYYGVMLIADASSISRNDIEDQLGSGVVAIHSNNNGFGILKNDGRAYFWGSVI